MKMRLIFLVLFPFMLLQELEAQNKGESTKADQADLIRKTETLYYFGLDCSHLRITDGPKVCKNSVYSTVYPAAWIAYLEKEMPPVQIQKSLGKKNFYYKQDEIYSVSINVFPNFIIGTTYSFPLDTVKSAINKYGLHQKSGIGLVLIPESFNKEQESAKVWVVFFDIQNREVLWASKVTGTCKHMGYTAHRGAGVVDAFERFIINYYNIF